MRLIQTGNFKKEGKELFGRTGLIDLDFMDEIELRTDAVPKSYNIIMHDFDNYNYYSTCITKDKDELILFCNKEQVEEELKYLTENQEQYSKAKNDFWWDAVNNWMLFPNEKMWDFSKSIDGDHKNWWMQRPEIEREHAYKLALTKKNNYQ